jgi:predicted nuclease of predicted toxin-antitoxin system
VRFLADECVDADVVRQLRAAGHDVEYAAEHHRSVDDVGLLAIATRTSRIFLTEDKDFGDLAFHGAKPASGIVLLRIAPVRRKLKWPRLRAAIALVGVRFAGAYTVIEVIRIRRRPLP